MGKIILLDIEGTTTSISFVKDVLFPYVRQQCNKFLSDNWDDPIASDAVHELIRLGFRDKRPIRMSTLKDQFVAAVEENICWQMDNDRKTPELKMIQGLIWKEGYETSILKGHVYDDVARNFEEWTTLGHKLYIYSSGSVDAQKLIFKYSIAGDLQKYISGYYDTTVGSKDCEQSYLNILNDIGAKGDDVLFLSDMVSEVQAAQNVGIQVMILDRKDSPPPYLDTRKRFKVLQTFDEINF
ncbi:unnamed protein product [Diamesa serratosioi]